MGRKLICLLLLFVFPLICFAQDVAPQATLAPPEGTEISSDEYKVYSDLLLQLHDKDKLLVILNNTTIGHSNFNQQSVEYFEKESGQELDKELVQDFQDKNRNNYTLENKFINVLEVVLISPSEIEELCGPEIGRDKFYKKFPQSNGITELSRAGFNKEKNFVFIYYGNNSAPLGGIGKYVLLKKVDDKWKVVAEVMAWIS